MTGPWPITQLAALAGICLAAWCPQMEKMEKVERSVWHTLWISNPLPRMVRKKKTNTIRYSLFFINHANLRHLWRLQSCCGLIILKLLTWDRSHPIGPMIGRNLQVSCWSANCAAEDFLPLLPREGTSKTSKSHMQCESQGFGACHRSGAEGHLPPDLPVFHQVLSRMDSWGIDDYTSVVHWGFSPRSWRWQQLAAEPRSACCRRACDLSWGKAMTKDVQHYNHNKHLFFQLFI